MQRSLFGSAVTALVIASLGLTTLPAAADSTNPFGSVMSGANTALKNALDQHPKKHDAGLPDDTIAQVPPINQQPVGGKSQAGLPTGFSYFADLSVAYPYGNIGNFGSKWLPGGIDAMAAYGFTPSSRVVASYYELQHYPVGFNSGQVNTFLPSGFPLVPGVNPSCTDLSGASSATCAGIPSKLDVTTKDRFLLLNFEQLISLGTMKGRSLPIVITPTFVSRWSTVAASNGNSDIVAFVDQNGVPHTNIHTRTAQYDSLAITAPFLKTPKMFGTFTVAPTWLTHLNGINQTNHAQLYQLLYLEYTPTSTTRLFIEPQSSRDYLPADPYPQHLVAYFLGATQRFAKVGFVQVVLNSGSPANYSPYGVKYFQCFALPCSQNTIPAVGGLKATQVQLQVGVGSPVVLPF